MKQPESVALCDFSVITLKWLWVGEFVYSRYATFRYFILSVNLRMHVRVQRGWQCVRFWVSYTRVWGMWELTFRFWGGSLWSSRFLRSPPLFFLLHVAALKKTLAVSTDVEIILEESVCVWEAGLRLWSVGFRSIWERAEASPCPKAPWEGLGFGLLVNETPVLVRLEIALQNCKNVGPLMYLAEKQTRPTPHLTTPFSSCFHFLIYSGLFVYLCRNTFEW